MAFHPFFSALHFGVPAPVDDWFRFCLACLFSLVALACDMRIDMPVLLLLLLLPDPATWRSWSLQTKIPISACLLRPPALDGGSIRLLRASAGLEDISVIDGSGYGFRCSYGHSSLSSSGYSV